MYKNNELLFSIKEYILRYRNYFVIEFEKLFFVFKIYFFLGVFLELVN